MCSVVEKVVGLISAMSARECKQITLGATLPVRAGINLNLIMF